MCGDVDEEAGEGEDALYARFLARARTLLEERPQGKPGGASADPYAYMDKLFADALARCVRDGEEATQDARYRRLALQALVFARLAGFLAGHLALEEDPLRQVIEALMRGYAEAGPAEADHDHDHDHDHGHDHEHEHHH
jgi:hypothetical protein